MVNDQFTVTYDGEALASHTMDVRDLAPALLGLGTLFQEAGKTLYGPDSDVRVHATATAPGCFSIDLAVLAEYGVVFRDLLTSENVQATLTLKELIISGTLGSLGLFSLIRKLKGKAPASVDPLERNTVRITMPDGLTIDVNQEVADLYRSHPVRQAVEDALRPLEQDGIEEIEFTEHGESLEKVEKNEVKIFEAPSIGDEIVLEQTIEAAYNILNLAFKSSNKWRLYDGVKAISVTIEDEEFLKLVHNNQISFSKDDVLICEVEVVTRRADGELKAEHTIKKVIAHKPAMRQIPFDMEG